MSLRNTLRKAAGLLVELPPEEPEQKADALPDIPTESGVLGTVSSTDKLWDELEKASQKPSMPPAAKTVEQIVREGEGPNLDQIKVQADSLPPASNPDGTVNFSALYQAANLPA